MRVRQQRRPCARLSAGLACFAVALLGVAGPAGAEPGDEGGSPTLAQALEAASKGYLDAQAAVAASQARQGELTAQAADVEVQLSAKATRPL